MSEKTIEVRSFSAAREFEKRNGLENEASIYHLMTAFAAEQTAELRAEVEMLRQAVKAQENQYQSTMDLLIAANDAKDTLTRDLAAEKERREAAEAVVDKVFLFAKAAKEKWEQEFKENNDANSKM